MQTNQTFHTVNYDVTPAEKDIDYFKLPVHQLLQQGFDVNMNLIPLAGNEWLSVENHLNRIDHGRVETIAFNIQVGKGKTTACYKLIEKYSKEGYIVIVLSPFKKLVEKDCENLKSRGLTPFNYDDLVTTMNAAVKPGYHFDFPPHFDHTIHVMTINCLLQNPGEDSYDQAQIKQQYLYEVLQDCEQNERKVILFFDEIHESIHNFQAEYVPNLIRWKSIVHKVYVSTATYTPAAIPVLRYIAALTDGKITVYETPRLKVDQPASLHLHFVEKTYSGKNIASLTYLTEIIRQNEGKRINILTGYKNIAKGLINSRDTQNADLVTAILSLNPNLVTADEEIPFKQDANNIGTTFKTGVDIIDSNSVLIIIVPCINEGNEEYGIFNDGLPSIIQSMARIRRIGQVHVFLLQPTVVIDKELSQVIFTQGDFSAAWSETYMGQNTFLGRLYSNYVSKRTRITDEIRELGRVQNSGLMLGYEYPNFSTILLEKSQGMLLKNHYSYGKHISPYILWAALFNQFCNATLKQISFTSTNKRIITLIKETVVSQLKEIITDSMLTIAKQRNLSDAIEYIVYQLRSGLNEDETEGLGIIQFEYQDRNYSVSELRWSPFFVKAIVDILCNAYTESRVTTMNKEDYILGCTEFAATREPQHSEQQLLYQRLNNLKNRFIFFLESKTVTNNKGEVLIHRDINTELDDSFITECNEVISRLNETDSVLRSKTFPFATTLQGTAEIMAKKRVIYGEFEKCFTNITDAKRSYQGEKERYYLVDGSIAKTLPAEFNMIPWL